MEESRVPYGYCLCGCGERTKIAPRTDSASGWIKGEPLRYIRNHHVRRPTQAALTTDEGAAIPLVGKYGEGETALIDQEDYPKVGGYRWHLSRGGYVVTSLSVEKKLYLHRLVMPEGDEVDHVNGNTLDNRRANLRSCTHHGNVQNRRPWKQKSSRHLGVYWRKDAKKWTAAIKGRHLGYFDKEEDAALSYNEAARKEYGQFARLNRLTPEGRE
ncbi:hypothetical protein BH24ACT18_BH24ACT18_18900 [soil metagenome]